MDADLCTALHYRLCVFFFFFILNTEALKVPVAPWSGCGDLDIFGSSLYTTVSSLIQLLGEVVGEKEKNLVSLCCKLTRWCYFPLDVTFVQRCPPRGCIDVHCAETAVVLNACPVAWASHERFMAPICQL